TTNYQLIVSEDISLNGRLVASGDSSFMGNLYVDDFLTANLKLVANSDASFCANVYVADKVGIKTSNPLAFCHIYGNAATLASNNPDGGSFHNLCLTSTKTAVSGNPTPFSMALGIDFTSGFGYINAGGDGAFQPVCLQTRGGNVGIRTTAPAGLLDISGSSVRTTIIANGNVGIGTTAPSGLLDISGSSVRTTIIANGNVGIGTTAPSGLLDITGTAVRTTIITNGNVGIGTTVPTAPFEVSGNVIVGNMFCYSNPTYGMFIGNKNNSATIGTTDFALYQGPAGDTVLNSKAAQNIQFKIGNAEKMRMDANGNVGIGTTAPSGLLDINGSSVRTTIIANGNVGIATTAPSGLLDINGTSIRTTIIANGNVGIGTTTPSVPLQVTSIGAGFSTGAGYRFFTSGTSSLTNSATAGTLAPSILSSGAVVSNVGFYAYSDRRIKKNIMDATDLSCSYILQYLKPKIFNFVDIRQYNIEPVWGFIAQEVKEIIPNAITFTKEYITNIYE
ncbi:MAG: tail fiber domain-containing protein, partial [Alphaproteobacteria bacterium]|nr:tail fiber domain-containing protein [Alphaproteobacteria bacterium]